MYTDFFDIKRGLDPLPPPESNMPRREEDEASACCALAAWRRCDTRHSHEPQRAQMEQLGTAGWRCGCELCVSTSDDVELRLTLLRLKEAEPSKLFFLL